MPVFSRETFAEFKTVLQYPKFSLTGQEIKMIIEEEVLPFFGIAETTNRINGVCRDPDDDKFIACAVSASANFIVTGDKDLLDMGKYRSVRIISGSTLLEMKET
jgi:putative PIN family toxin of toxin-antitoxin system